LALLTLLYDLAGHLIADSTDTGATLREYIWLDELTLCGGNRRQSPDPYFVYADQKVALPPH
jgi:hypothetical protein